MAVRTRGRERGRRPGGRAKKRASWAGAAGTSIPFDHVATFRLQGRPGNVVEDVINVSVEGRFVATTLSYGFEPDDGGFVAVPVIRGLHGSALEAVFRPDRLSLGRIPVDALVNGFRATPGGPALSVALRDDDGSAASVGLATTPINAAFRDTAFQTRRSTSTDAGFLFSAVDTATGRELQMSPTHNIASLGTSSGERPFRRLASPLSFEPRSTLRLQVIELIEGARGTLTIVLGGYKVLPTPAGDPSERGRGGAASTNGGRPRSTPEKVLPFDYVASLELVGVPGNRLETEIPINVEGGFVTTHVGYGLAPASGPRLTLGLPEGPGAPDVPLNNVRLSQFPIAGVIDGFRIRPELLRSVMEPGGDLATVSPRLANRAFEYLPVDGGVSFTYALHDTGTGRALQSEPLHSLAGLGIADGSRPFKRLARPMTFLPRSSIRIEVIERRGRGRLYLAFHGYKRLAAAGGSR